VLDVKASGDADADADADAEGKDDPVDSETEEPEMSSRDIFAQLVRFTLPTMAIWMCGPVLSLVDTSVVGIASTLELAAMSPGGSFVDYPSYLVSSSLAVATTTLVAQDRLRDQRERKRRRESGGGGQSSDGGGDEASATASAAASTISDGLTIAVLAGVAMGAALLLVARPAIAAFAGPASAAVVPAALIYATVRCYGMPAALVTSVAQASFLACRSPWQPLAAVATAGVVNLVGDLVLVCAMGRGIGGAAWATVGSQVTMAIALVYALLLQGKEKRRRRIAQEGMVEGGKGVGAVGGDGVVDARSVRTPATKVGAVEERSRAETEGGREEAGAAAGESTSGSTARASPANGSAESAAKNPELANDDAAMELPSLDHIPYRIPGAATTMRFLRIAGPVCFLNSIKVAFVASLVQAVTAISPESSAANGVMTAVYFFFAVMGDGVSQAAQTFLPPVLGSRRATNTALLLLASALCLGCFSAVLSAAVAIGAPTLFTSSAEVAIIMRQCAPGMSLALLLHTASMGSEGCLLASRDMRFMTLCYVPNAAAAYYTLTLCIGGEHGGGLTLNPEPCTLNPNPNPTP
jgi:Na+-driven multidrug efflux pump